MQAPMTDEAPEEHPLIKQLRDGGLLPAKEPPKPRAPYVPSNTPLVGMGTAYGLAALQDECMTLATMPPDSGRNHQLNTACFSIRQLVDGNELNAGYAWQQLESAAKASGLDDSEIGPTMKSGWGSAPAKAGPRAAPPQEQVPEAYQLDAPPAETTGDAAETTERAATDFDDPYAAKPEPPERDMAAVYDELVDQSARLQYIKLRATDEAKARIAAERAEAQNQTRPRPIRLTDFLAVDDPPALYRINDNLPVGGNVLLAAQQKAGKTSMIGNTIRALVDGELFLDKWECTPVDRLVLFDNELDTRMVRRWLRDQGIQNTDAVEVVLMKGKLGQFNILEDNVRAEWARELAGADVAIFDPLRPAMDALGLSEDKEAGLFLQAWDALKVEAEVDETIMVHHMGHNGDRARGDSRLIDWADVNWKIRKESQKQSEDEFEPLDDGGQRFYTAHGRDVYVPEGLLAWDPTDRRIRFVGKVDTPVITGVKGPVGIDYRQIMLKIIREYAPSPVNFNALWKAMNTIYSVPVQQAKDTIHAAQTDGTLDVQPGPNRQQFMTENSPVVQVVQGGSNEF